MGALERRLVEQFEAHEQTAEALLPADADRETVALQRGVAQYVALKEALVEIGRAVDQVSDERLPALERRLQQLGESLAPTKGGKNGGKKKRKGS